MKDDDFDTVFDEVFVQEQLQTLPTDMLVAAVNGEWDVIKLMHKELVSRGFSPEARGWVGKFKAATEYMDRWSENPEF